MQMSSYDNLADNFRGFKGILGDFRGFYECDFAQDFDEGRPFFLSKWERPTCSTNIKQV